MAWEDPRKSDPKQLVGETPPAAVVKPKQLVGAETPAAVAAEGPAENSNRKRPKTGEGFSVRWILTNPATFETDRRDAE